MEEWYVGRLIEELSKTLPCVIISTPETNHFYKNVLRDNVRLINTTVSKAFDIIARSKLMLATDSGFRCLAYGADVPTLTFSSSSDAPHQAIPSHQIRWLPFPHHSFPLNFDAVYVAETAERILKDKGYSLLPYITDIDSQLVRRKYTINEEKTR
jgi:ADP-heptose:LPS heptosyltransferase